CGRGGPARWRRSVPSSARRAGARPPSWTSNPARTAARGAGAIRDSCRPGRRQPPGPRAASVAGRLVEDDDEADDLAVADAEVVRQDELLREIGPVERAVIGAADDGVAVVVKHLAHVDPDLVPGHLLGDPAADGLGAGELAAGVVDVGVR